MDGRRVRSASVSVLVLKGTLKYVYDEPVSDALETGSARGMTVEKANRMGAFSPTYLYAYADRTTLYDRTRPYETFVDVHRGEETEFSITFKANPDGTLRSDAHLCFMSYVTSVTDLAKPVEQDSGSGAVLLRTLLKAWHVDLTVVSTVPAPSDETFAGLVAAAEYEASDADRPGDLRLALKNHGTDDDRVTGSVTLSLRAVYVSANVRFGPAGQYSNDPKNGDRIFKELNAYMKRFVAENDGFQPFVSGTEHIDCPVLVGEVVPVNDNRLRLPVGAFALYSTPFVSSDYWHGALAILADRHQKSLRSFCDDYLTAPPAQQARFAAALVVQYVQQLPYVSDRCDVADGNGRFHKQSVEMFGDALVARAGDCEDLMCATCQLLSAFKDDFDPSVSVAKSKLPEAEITARVLARMQHVLRQYVVHGAIEGITSPSVEGRKRNGKRRDEVQGAHAAVKLVPAYYHYACMARWNPDHPLAKMPASTYDPSLENELPVLVLEGTGMLDPLPGPDPEAASRRLLEACPALVACKKMIRPLPGGSPFYKWVGFSMLRETFKEYRTVTYRWAKPSPEGGSYLYTKGVRYEDLMTQSPDVALIPFNASRPVKETTIAAHATTLDDGHSVCEYTPAMAEIMRSVTATRIHPPPIRLDATREADPEYKTLDAKSGVAALDDLIRHSGNPNVRATSVVSAYGDRATLSRPVVAQGIRQHMDRFPRVYASVTYVVERHADSLEVVRLDFRCNEEAAVEACSS